jgi:uncharacterized protein
MPIEWIQQDKCRKMLGPQVYGRLATTGKDSIPYSTPVNYAYADDAIYIHCGLKGRKLDNIAANPAVCFEISSSGNLYISDKACGFAMRYWSIIIEGRAELVSDLNEKRRAMDSIMQKYAGRFEFTDPSDDDLKRINVIKINIASISGKLNLDPQE